MQAALPSFTRLPKKPDATVSARASSRAGTTARSAAQAAPSFSSSDAGLPSTDLPQRAGRKSQAARTDNDAPQNTYMTSTMALASPPPAGSALDGRESALLSHSLSRSSAANGSSQGPNATSVSVPGDGGEDSSQAAAEMGNNMEDSGRSKQGSAASATDTGENDNDENSRTESLADSAADPASSELHNAEAGAAPAKRRGRPPGSSKVKRQQQMANAKAARKLELDTRREQRLLLGQSQSPVASTSGTNNAPAASTAMSRTDSATSRASTRSMRSKDPRGTKRKFDDNGSDLDSNVENDTATARTEKGVTPSSSARKSKHRQSDSSKRYTDAGSTEPESRQASPTATGDEAATPWRPKSRLRLFLKPSTLRQNQNKDSQGDSAPSASSSRAPSAAPAKVPDSSARRRAKRRIEESDNEDETASPTTSRAPSTAAGQDMNDRNDEPTLETGLHRAISADVKEMDMDLEQAERDTSIASSVSVPLASSRRTSGAAFLNGQLAMNALSAKLEPMSDDDTAMGGESRAASAGADSAHYSHVDSVEEDNEDASRANTPARRVKGPQSPDEAKSTNRKSAASSASKRANKNAHVKGTNNRLRLPNNAHFAASDAEDDLSSVAGTSMGFPTPSEEKDVRLGGSAPPSSAQGQGAPNPFSTKKRRGRPPKTKLGLEATSPTTPGASTPRAWEEGGSSTNSDKTVKDRLYTTLNRERQLIEEGTHPLFLEALVEYDHIRQEKIQTQQTILETKENVAKELAQATEESLWQVWVDQKRELWYEMMMDVRQRARRLSFETSVEKAAAVDASGLLGGVASQWWGRSGRLAPFTFPPTIEPLVKVATAPVAAPKGRTRSSNKPLIEAGKAYMIPLNLKDAQGLSTLSKDEIALDLEIIGLSSRGIQENWFHTHPVYEGEQLRELEPVQEDIELEQEMLPLPSAPPADHASVPLYASPVVSARARNPYGLPIHADANYDPSRLSRYAHAPPDTFSFPSSARSHSPGRHKTSNFAFPSGRRGGPTGPDFVEGRSKADAILIEDGVSPIKADHYLEYGLPPHEDSGYVEPSSLRQSGDRTMHNRRDYQQWAIEKMNDRIRYLPGDHREAHSQRELRDEAAYAAPLKRGRPRATPNTGNVNHAEQRYDSSAQRSLASDASAQERIPVTHYQGSGRGASPSYPLSRHSPPTMLPGQRERTVSHGQQDVLYKNVANPRWSPEAAPVERIDPRYAPPPVTHQRHHRVPSYTSRESSRHYDDYGRPIYPSHLYRDTPPPGHPDMYGYPASSYYNVPPPLERYGDDARLHGPDGRAIDPYRGGPSPPTYYYTGAAEDRYPPRVSEQYAIATGHAPPRSRAHEFSAQKLPQSRYHGYAAHSDAQQARPPIRQL